MGGCNQFRRASSTDHTAGLYNSYVKNKPDMAGQHSPSG